MPLCTPEHYARHGDRSVVCSRCGWCSAHPMDKSTGWCANCHAFTSSTIPRQRLTVRDLFDALSMSTAFDVPDPMPVDLDRAYQEFLVWLKQECGMTEGGGMDRT